MASVKPPVKTIKVTDYSHRRLKMMSAKSGEHVYEIVEDLVRRIPDALMAHALGRDHRHAPDVCSGCEGLEKAVERDRKR